MIDFDLMKELTTKNDKKILYIVIDGLGDLPHPDFNYKTPLEAADIPNLDKLARGGNCGLTIPVDYGITPGSGPAHLSLFGYDPIKHDVGRGVLSALGVGIELKPSDVAARVNFCNIDNDGIITDRRAGRIPTEVCAERCEELSSIKLEDVEIIIKPEMEYRAALILRGKGLGGNVTDTDPQVTGKIPLKAEGLDKESKHSADLFNKFTEEAKKVLSNHDTANMVLLRGFDRYEHLPQMQDVYKLNPACIATFPMYRGVTKLLGMKILKTGMAIKDEFKTLEDNYNDHDFFYLHIKKTDSAGEDGNFEKKVKVLEELDKELKILDKLHFDVIVVCGDHSTPCIMKSHSWHPVPAILFSDKGREDQTNKFTETECQIGVLGTFHAVNLMPMTLASAGKIKKFGA